MTNDPAVAFHWIYSLADYRQMFDLTDQDLSLPILDFPARTSSFNAEMQALGHLVVSGDPHYGLSGVDMGKHATELLREHQQYLEAHERQLAGGETVDHLHQAWLHSQQLFLEDYVLDQDKRRYQQMDFPKLPFEDHHFRLALCSDFIFHEPSRRGDSPESLLNELCRVAEEVRIFPLLDADDEIAEELGAVLLAWQRSNFGVEVREVDFKQQTGSNAMLRVWTKACVI